MQISSDRRSTETNRYFVKFVLFLMARLFHLKKLLILLLIICLLVIYSQQHLISYFFDYIKLIIHGLVIDSTRREKNAELTAELHWQHFQLQAQFMDKICESKEKRKDFLWLTALVNDEYAVPAVVLGHSIRTLSCVKNMVVLASNDVSHPAREALTKVGWNVKIVTAMDCKWLEKQLGQSPSNIGIKGTHTRFHAWNYTQYSKIIYADPDYMLMTSIDELFEIKGDFAAAHCNRHGIVDPCFNAGMIVFRPSSADYQGIMDTWITAAKEGLCPSDQMVLYYHYAFHGKWEALPFAYNVRRLIHYPMKAYHFVCCPPNKPWKMKCRPSRDEARSYDRGIRDSKDIVLVYWKKFYEALRKYHIDEWWRSTKYYNAELEFGKHLFSDCWDYTFYWH